MGSPFKDELTTKFHDHYRRQTNGEGPPKIKWLGYDTLKCPMDLWIYQEIIHEIQPRYIIEGGTCTGGSALFMATILDALGCGNVLTIDWDADESRPKHPRIQYIIGNTVHIETVQKVRNLVQDPGHRMLVLDDGHDHDHVCDARSNIPFAHHGSVCGSRDLRDDFPPPTGGNRRAHDRPSGDSHDNRDHSTDRFE